MTAESATPSSAATVFAFDPRVRAELVAVLYAQARAAVYGNLVIALATFFFFLNKVPFVWLTVWIALTVLLNIARLVLVECYERAKPSVAQASRWGHYFALALAVAGLLWSMSGLAILVFMPPDPVVSVFIFALFAVSVPVLASYLPAFYLFTAPLLLPIVIGLLLRVDELHVTLAIMASTLMLVSFKFARNVHRTMGDSIALRFENIHLIQELQEKKTEADVANVAKSKFLAAASHDLRQPLHALMLFASALNERTRFPEMRKIVENIKGSTQALEKLFGSLLDISRLDAGAIGGGGNA